MAGFDVIVYIILCLLTFYRATQRKPGNSSSVLPHFVCYPLALVIGGAIGAGGSYLAHGQQAVLFGIFAGVGATIFTLMSRSLYDATNAEDWTPPSKGQRPVPRFTAAAIPTGAVLGMLIGWMIPAGSNVELMGAPFVLMLFGVLIAAIVGAIYEAVSSRQTVSVQDE